MFTRAKGQWGKDNLLLVEHLMCSPLGDEQSHPTYLTQGMSVGTSFPHSTSIGVETLPTMVPDRLWGTPFCIWGALAEMSSTCNH